MLLLYPETRHPLASASTAAAYFWSGKYRTMTSMAVS